MKNTTKTNQNKPTKNTKKGKKIQKNVGSVKADKLVYRVPHCAALYAAALVDPFDAPCGACVPADLFPLPSSKTKTFIRGRFALGTSGFGYITARPGCSNTAQVVTVTQATSVGTSATLFSAFTNLATIQNNQIPYTAAQITAGVGARIVAFGIRIKYIGQLMTRNGLAMGYEDPDHANFATLFSWDTMGANPYVKAHRIGGEEWDTAVCYSGPVAPSDIEFLNSEYPLGLNLFAGIAVSGVAGDNYEFEFYQHTEFIGNIVVNKTSSHADAQAFGKVLESAKALTKDKPLQPNDAPSFWNRLKDGFLESLPQLFSAGKAVMGAISGPTPMSILKASGTLNAIDFGMSDRSRHLLSGSVNEYESPFKMIGM